MAEKTIFTERRQFTRFQIKDAVIFTNAQLGELIDISFGGISFRYTSPKAWSRKTGKTALLYGEDDFCLQVPLMLVSDSPINGKAGHDSPGRLRRRGMRFGDLSSTQLLQLVAFIRDNTTEEELFELL